MPASRRDIESDARSMSQEGSRYISEWMSNGLFGYYTHQKYPFRPHSCIDLYDEPIDALIELYAVGDDTVKQGLRDGVSALATRLANESNGPTTNGGPTTTASPEEKWRILIATCNLVEELQCFDALPQLTSDKILHQKYGFNGGYNGEFNVINTIHRLLRPAKNSPENLAILEEQLLHLSEDSILKDTKAKEYLPYVLKQVREAAGNVPEIMGTPASQRLVGSQPIAPRQRTEPRSPEIPAAVRSAYSSYLAFEGVSSDYWGPGASDRGFSAATSDNILTDTREAHREFVETCKGYQLDPEAIMNQLNEENRARARSH